MRQHQAGLTAELFTTNRHYGISLIASVHSSNSLGTLARWQICTLIVFPIANRKEYESVQDQYSQLAGRDKSVFDAIYDLAAGPGCDLFSFRAIHTNSENPDKTFMLRLESWIVPK